MNEHLRQTVLDLMNRHGIAVLDYEGPDGTLVLDAERAVQVHAKVFADTPGVFLSRHPAEAVEPVWPRHARAGQIIGWLKVGPLLRPVTASEDTVVTGPTLPDGSLAGYGDRLF
jgi:acetyl-CoA carboxylase biotin carboxyl carrier protein